MEALIMTACIRKTSVQASSVHPLPHRQQKPVANLWCAVTAERECIPCTDKKKPNNAALTIAHFYSAIVEECGDSPVF